LKNRLLASWSSRSGPSSVRGYLLLVALTCTVPVAVVGGFFAYYFVAEGASHRQADVEERLALMRSAVDQRVEKVIAELAVLSHSPDLLSGNFDRFRSHAEETAKLIGAVAIVVSDKEGNQVLNTRPLLPGAIPKRQHLEALLKAWETATPQVSDLYPAAVDAQQVISVEVPVIIDGSVGYMLAAGIVAATFSDLTREYVPEGAIGSIIDKNGILVAREPPSNQLIGTKAIPELLPHIGEPYALWIKAQSRSGVPTYTSILRSALSGWTVDLAVPRDFVDGPLRRALLLFTAIGLGALLLGLLLARLVSKRFLRAFAVLQDHVRLLGSRQSTLPVRGPVTEINAMDETLYRVANHLNEIMHRQELLLGEINHRVKNTLATINAIARLTRKSAATVPDFVEAFQGRVFALSRAYDLLTNTDWAGADLCSLVETTVAPYKHSNSISTDGPKILVRPKFALAIAAALQELTTNAAKYGALSGANGALRVQWQSDGRMTRLEWIESGGPPVQPPVRRGFGTQLVQELLAKDTGWQVEVKYLPSGVECRIAMYDGIYGDNSGFAQAVH
jgi:two-component sensor histidine kinase